MKSVRQLFDMSLSRGECSRAFAYVMVAVGGAMVGYAVVLRLSMGQVLGRSMTAYDIWMISAAAFGSMCGLYLAGDRFGHLGWRGLGQAMIASVWVSFAGSIIGGTLMLPFYGTMFGPFTLVVTLGSAPFLALLWFANLMGAHGLLSTWKRERDTIFTAAEDREFEAYRRRKKLPPDGLGVGR